MSTARVHFLESFTEGEFAIPRSLCGMLSVEWTEDVDAVTCRLCAKHVRNPVPVPQRPRSLAGAVDSNGVRFDDPNRVGCRVDLRIDKEIVERPRWRTWQDAVRQLIQWRDDGYPVKSTSDPTRFEGMSQGKSEAEGDRAQRIAGEFAIVGKLYDEAYREAWVVQDTPRHEIAPAQCSAILEVVVAGWARPGHAVREEADLGVLAQQLSETLLFAVTRTDVWRVAMAGAETIEDGLMTRGLVGHRERKVETYRMEKLKRPWDYQGWKEIAEAVGMSVRTVQRWASEKDDPLPTRDIGGMVIAVREEVEAWLRRKVSSL